MMDEVKGCSDHNCIFGHPGGMGTNGGCRCLDLHRDPDRRIMAMKNIRALRATVARLEKVEAAALNLVIDIRDQWGSLPDERLVRALETSLDMEQVRTGASVLK